jgi:hypothetical protein
MKLLHITAAVLAALLTGNSFAQADSTLRRNFRPAVGGDPVVNGGSGLTLGTQYTGGNIENASPDACYAGAGLPFPRNTFWFNNTDAVLAVNMTARDSGIGMATYILTPNGLVEAGVAVGGTATVFVPARSPYCKVGEVGAPRTSSRVDALANGLRESDFHQPIAAGVSSGSCVVPGGQDPNNGNQLPDVTAFWQKTTIGAPVNTATYAGMSAVAGVGLVTSPTLAGITVALGCP